MHSGICAVQRAALARYFELNMELIRALQLLKLSSVSTGKVEFLFRICLKTSAKRV